MAYPENVGSVRKPTFGKLGGNDGFVPDHVSSTRQPCNERMAAFDELAGAWERPLWMAPALQGQNAIYWHLVGCRLLSGLLTQS